MQISVVGTVATIKSNIKFADLQKVQEVILTNEKNEPIYCARVGHTWSKTCASFNNADASGNAIYQIVVQPNTTPDEVKNILMNNMEAYKAFELVEQQIIDKMTADAAAREEFANSIVIQ